MSEPKVQLVCYSAAKDEPACDELLKHLANFPFELWSTRQLADTEYRDETIKRKFREAGIIVLLVSPDLVAPRGVDLAMVKIAMEHGRQQEALVIPVRLYDAEPGPLLTGIEMLPKPKNSLPLRERPAREQNRAFLEVARAILDAWQQSALRLRPRPASAAAEAPPAGRSPHTTNTISAAEVQERAKHEVSQEEARLRRRRQRLGGLAVLLSLAVLLLLFAPPLQVPRFSKRGGALVVVPWVSLPGARQLHARLCADLQRMDRLAVECLTIARRTSKEETRAAAARAGAAVAAFVEPDESVVIAPLGGGPLPVELLPPVKATDAEMQRVLVEILATLGRPADGAPPRADVDAALADAFKAGHELALLVALRGLLWQGGRSPYGAGMAARHSALLEQLSEELCRGRRRDARDTACALARYLDAIDCPSAKAAFCAPKVDALRGLARDAADPRLRFLAGIEVARRTCATSPNEAHALLGALAAQIPADRPCDRLLLLPPATCLLATKPSVERARAATVPAVPAETRGCEALGGVLAEQGYWWMKGQRWEEARAAFTGAYAAAGDAEQAVNLAEVLLVLGQKREARSAISLQNISEPSLKTHAAFLQWLATGTEQDQKALEESYAALPPGQPGVFDATGALAGLACKAAESSPCRLFQALREPKSAGQALKTARDHRRTGVRPAQP